jgi:WD40 repeat protein
MSGKYALIIGNTEYTDPGLAQLTAPSKDAEDFARVLRDQDICAFDDVKVLLNQPEHQIREAIYDLFSIKKPDDLLVLYFSGHGVRDEFGALYLAVRNTNKSKLSATAVDSSYITRSMDQSRSKRQVLILDCCNSGAFAQGTKAATGVSIGTATAFEAGYGRIILTASDATQFAWEGDKIIGETDNSLFTHFLVQGLEGEADLDGNGRITVDELYDYSYEKVKLATPKQTPSKFSSKQQGEIILRENIHIEDIQPIPLPAPLLDAIENPFADIRLGAVQELAKLLHGKNPRQARSAREALEQIEKDDDSRRVAQVAKQILESVRQAEQLALQYEEEKHLVAEKMEDELKAKELAELKAEEGIAEAKTEAGHITEKGLITDTEQNSDKEEVEELLSSRVKHKFSNKTIPTVKEKNEKVDDKSKDLNLTRERAARERYIYVIADDGTPLYQSLPASSNWTVWLEKGAKLSVSKQVDELGKSIGKYGHYFKVTDVDDNQGYVLATAVSVTRSTKEKAAAEREATHKVIKVQDEKQTAELATKTERRVLQKTEAEQKAKIVDDEDFLIWREDNAILLQSLEGHTDLVNDIAFSPDGQNLASGSADHTIRLWQVSTGKLLRILKRHADSVNDIVFSPDGQTLASGSDDNTVRLWRVSDGKPLQTLEGHKDWVTGVTFSPDGQKLASGSFDKTVHIWRVSDGKLLLTLSRQVSLIWALTGNYISGVNSLAFSPDGQKLASGSYDNTIGIWSISDRKLLWTLKGHINAVNDIAFSPDGQTLASGSIDNTIRLWQVNNGKLLRILKGHTNSVNHVIFSRNGQTLASGSADHTLRIWRISDGKLLRVLKEYTKEEFSFAFSPNGRVLALSSSGDNTIHLWGIKQ